MRMNLINLNRTILLAGILSLSAAGAFAQTARPEFEVASVKPAPPPSDNRIRISMAGGPGTPDPGRINFEFVNLRMVLAQAYNVKDYQISGPAWLDSERFNITAKVPQGATKEQFRVMLQNLVADRFKLTLHRERKDLPAFSLIVAKNGPKLKPSAPDDPNASPAATADALPPPGRMPMGKDGFPQMPPGARGRGLRMMMMPGRARLSGDAMTVTQFCDALSQQLDRAVVDNTGLTGKYDLELTFEPDQNRMMAGLGRGGPGPGDGGPPHETPAAEAPATIFTAIQEQLGLKLDPKKEAVEVLVIDHMEKTPIDN
jgi:uncharacterized protein (TIGR03435 family)